MNIRNFLLVLFTCSGLALSAQNPSSKTIYFDKNPTGKINRVQLQDDNSDVIGSFSHKRLPNGTTEIGIDYTALGSSGVRVELKKQGRTIYLEEYAGNGPNPFVKTLSKAGETLYSKEFMREDMNQEEDWIIFVLAVAYCCVEIEVSHNADDSYSSSITFDCDCLSISLSNSSIVTNDGQEYNDVDEIILTAL
ncbi:MAG: hypothetical protein HKN09_12315 [Saprospiraceae bacterium]|nr:hypothetical protein [Saprospiraceae bacterium]